MKTKDYIINYANQMRAVLLTKCYEYETEYLIGHGISKETLKEYEQYFIVHQYDDDDRSTRYTIDKKINNLY